MSMKKGSVRSVFAIFILLIILLFLMPVTEAWLVSGTNTNSMRFQAGFIKSIITIYEGIDFDHDGILDRKLEMENDAQVEVEKYLEMDKLYEEGYNGQEDYQLFPLYISDGSVENGLIAKEHMVWPSGIIPTQIYTWRLDVRNNGDVTSNLTFMLYPDGNTDGSAQNTIADEALMTLSFKALYNIDGIEHASKVYLADHYNWNSNTSEYEYDTALGPVLLFEDILADPVGYGDENVVTIILKVEFEILDSINERLNARGVAPLTDSHYQEFQGMTFNTLKIMSLLEEANV